MMGKIRPSAANSRNERQCRPLGQLCQRPPRRCLRCWVYRVTRLGRLRRVCYHRCAGLTGPEAARNGFRALASRGMRMTTLVRTGLLVCMLLGFGPRVMAQDSPAQDEGRADSQQALLKDSPAPSGAQDESQSAPSRRMTPPPVVTRESDVRASPLTPFRALMPNFSGTTITWIAVVLILALLLQTRPFLSWL